MIGCELVQFTREGLEEKFVDIAISVSSQLHYGDIGSFRSENSSTVLGLKNV